MRTTLFKLIFVSILFPLLVQAQIQDRYISSTVEKYFNRTRTAPTLMSVELVNDFMYGRTLKVHIIGHRNSENEDIGFAFGAAAAIASQVTTPFESLWVEMDVRYKDTETTIAVAPATCSVDAIVRKSKSFGSWWENCLTFL